MKTQELRSRISNLARSQLTADQISQSLQELVRGLDQLEAGQQKEVSRLRRQFRWLWMATATGLLALCLTCSWLCWQGHQLRQVLSQSQVQMAQQQQQLSQQQNKLELHGDALLRILKRMTNKPPSQTGQP